MKGLFILFSVLCLLLDLADDGYVGKVKFVAPGIADSVTDGQQAKQQAGESVFEHGRNTIHALVICLLALLWHAYHFLVEAKIPLPRKITFSRQLCSSGGLPS